MSLSHHTSKPPMCSSPWDWHSSESFWNQLEKNIPYIEHVYMAGGEPMMIERHYEFLQKCIDMNRAQHMIIEYNTNMTNLPNRVLKMWEHFKQVRVGASIDGMGKVLEYQRWPIKWDHALKNLQKLDNTPDNIIAWLAFTVTAYNVWHVPEFMWWKITESNFKKINSTKRRPIITHHVAHGPKRANIKLLPAHLKEELKKEYNKWIDKFKSESINENTQNNAESILTSILNYASAQDLTNWQEISTEHNQAEFIRFTRYIDSQRNQNVVDIVPQYKEIFHG